MTAQPVPGSPGAPHPAVPLVVTSELADGGRRRRYLLVRPPDVEPDATLVLVLHGSNQTGRRIRSFSGGTFDDLAARHGAVVVYPDAWRGLWNDARRATGGRARAEGVDDVAFLTALADHVQRQLGLTQRPVVAGYSNGGQMAIRLLHEVPELLTAVALIGATQPAADNLLVDDRHGSAPVLMIHGTRDPIAPYDGGVTSLFGWRPRGTGLSAPASAGYYAARNGVTASPSDPIDLPSRGDSSGTSVTRQHHQQAGSSPVELYTVHGGGHVVPNQRKRALRLLGRNTRDIDTGELLWTFVQALPDPSGP